MQHVTDEEQCEPNLVAQITMFNSLVNARLDDTNITSDDLNGESPYLQDYSLPAPDVHRGIISSDKEYGDMIVEPAPDDNEHPDLDNYIHTQLLLDIGGKQLQAHILKRVKEPDVTKKGKAHRNPMFNACAYLVEFKDGSVMEYTANIIAENIYSQVI